MTFEFGCFLGIGAVIYKLSIRNQYSWSSVLQSYMEGEDTPMPDNTDDVSEAINICSRYSPKEVFHTVINPHLFKILDGECVGYKTNHFH